MPGLKPSKPSNSSKSLPNSAGKRYPNKPNTRHARSKSHHKATAMAQGHPTAAAMASYRRLRLPFARPQTLQTLQILQSPPNSAGKRYPNKLNTRHARRQKPPQGHSNGSRAPPGRSNGSYRRSRLPFARPQTLQTLQKSAQLRREKVPQQA